MKSPVLFLPFNRPNVTRRVFEVIRAARPPRLYVAADGPREGHPTDVERCAEARRIATDVDWPCTVKTLFSPVNLGCRLGPIAGIDWLFKNEEEGIILEDDVLPLPGFFDYCDILLDRYRHDERVGVISGYNPVSGYFKPRDSYFFSTHMFMWGWATWRRAWGCYDSELRMWPAWRDQGGLRLVSGCSKPFERKYRRLLNRSFEGGVDWWDYQWVFTCWYHQMVGALPARNQIHYLGFGEEATHTLGQSPAYLVKSAPQALEFPLSHPQHVSRRADADMLIREHPYGMARTARVKYHLYRIPLFGRMLRRLWHLCRKARRQS